MAPTQTSDDPVTPLADRLTTLHIGTTPVVVCGPSGVGKGTLIGRLMKEYANDYGFSVSHTTRGPRPGEEDGVHYHFTTHEQIESMIAADGFLEHAKVHGNYYGTSLEAVQKVQQDGKVCVLDIDTQGAAQVKSSPMRARYVFISPPSMELLEERLRGRGTETEEKIQKRLGGAAGEMKVAKEPGFFDKIIVNDDLEKAYAEFVAFFKQ